MPHRTADAPLVPSEIRAIRPHRMHRGERVEPDQVDMRIQHHVVHPLTHEPVAPRAQPKTVMEHDDRFRPQHATQPAVRLPVERLEEAHRHMSAAVRLRRVAGGAGRGRGAVDQPADRLIEYLDAEQRRIVAIPCSQPGQHVQCEPDRLRTAVPPAYAGQSAVVVPVLRAGHGMQVDEDLEPDGVGPVECAVEELDAAGMS